MAFKYNIQCPACSQKLRIPFSSNTLKITCPRCGAIFMFKLKFADVYNKIIDFIFRPFKKPARRDNNFQQDFSRVNNTDRAVKIFWIWCAVVIFLIVFSFILKNISMRKMQENFENKSIYYEKSDSENKKGESI